MTTIVADPTVPVIRITRDFQATPEQLFRAHIDRYASIAGDGTEFGFRGCFHEVRPDRVVQTFTFEGEPDGVALETLWFEGLGNGRSRLHTQSLVDSFEARDAWLESGMDTGVQDGYAKLERMLADGTV